MGRRNPLVLIAETRQALRRAGTDRSKIERFTAEAMRTPQDLDRVQGLCSKWRELVAPNGA